MERIPDEQDKKDGSSIAMKDKFEHLDPKTMEIAGVSASVAAGCLSCLKYHFKKALEAGCNHNELAEAITLGKMIKLSPQKEIFELAEKLLEKVSKKP